MGNRESSRHHSSATCGRQGGISVPYVKEVANGFRRFEVFKAMLMKLRFGGSTNRRNVAILSAERA